MIKLVNGMEIALTPTEVLEMVAEQSAYVPPIVVLTKLYKSTFIRRLTASEATDLEALLNTEEAYVRLLYTSVEWFDVGDALVAYLHMQLTDAYGLERADALLAAEA